MVGRRITPAALAAAAALAALLGTGPRPLPALAVFACGALAAACGIALPRAAGRAAAAAGFGLAAGGLLSLSLALESARAHAGLAPEAVARIAADALEDSRPARGGGSAVLVGVRQAAGRDGALAAARGAARLLLPDPGRVTAGERLVARGTLARSGDPLAPFVFRARALERAGFVSALARARAGARAAVERAADRLGYPASALLLALFLGDRYGIPAEMEEAFARTGTLHLLALSGLHVGAIYLLAGAILRPLLRPRARWAAVALLACGYLWLAGPAPSLLRATLAFAAAGVARLADRDRRPANLLALVLFAHIVIDPRDAFTLAFQLSYLAVAGLAAGSALLARPLEKWLPPAVAVPVSVTAGAQAATLPLSLAAFGAWYPVGFVATLAGGPLVMLFLCAGLAALPLSALPGFDVAAPRALAVLYSLLLQGGRLLARAPAVVLAGAP